MKRKPTTSREIIALYQSIHEDVKKIDYLLDKLPEKSHKKQKHHLLSQLHVNRLRDEPEESPDEHIIYRYSQNGTRYNGYKT